MLLDTFIFTKSKYMTFHIVILSYCVLQLQGHNRKDTHSPKLWQHTACLYSSYWIMNYNYTFHQKLKSIEKNDKTTSPLSVHGLTLSPQTERSPGGWWSCRPAVSNSCLKPDVGQFLSTLQDWWRRLRERRQMIESASLHTGQEKLKSIYLEWI